MKNPSAKSAETLTSILIPQPLPLESRLLLAAASVSPSPNPQNLFHELSSVNWDFLLAEARRHGVMPQFSQWLETIEPESLPASVLDELRQTCRNILLKNLRMTGELFVLLKSFAAQGMQAIPFKGPTLAALAGDDLSWRSFGDLDLLLDRRDVAEASKVLRERGYELHVDWAASQDERFLDVTYALEFFESEKGLLVELHWELFPRYMGFDFNLAELKQRLTTVKPGGKTMETLAPEDLLLYLCAHGAKHFWLRLNGVVDVARLIASHDDWQWESLLILAERRKVMRVVQLGLLLAQGLLNAPVPCWIITQAEQDQALLRLARATAAEMLFPQQTGGMQRQFRYFFHLQQGWRARLLYLLRVGIAPNVGDWEFQPLSRKWAFLYVVLRPLRLLKKYLKLAVSKSP